MSVSEASGTLIGAGMGLGTGFVLTGMPGSVSSGIPESMTCRTFRKRHADFVDGLLAMSQSAEMYAHLDGCDRCARHHTALQRGLLVARNLPLIQPSPDFMARLQTRLRDSATAIPAPVSASTSGIAVKLGTAGVAAAVAVAVFFLLAPRPAPALPPVTAQNTSAIEAHASQDIPRRIGRERASAEPNFDAAVATMVPVLLPGVLAGDPTSPGLVEAASHAFSLSP